MVKRHNIILAGTVAVGLAASAYLGWGTYKEHKRQVAHEQNVVAMVERFKACPDRFVARRECFSETERAGILTEAEGARSGGRHREAGLKFAILGMGNEAREMAGRCNETDRRAIMEELRVREEAEARIRADGIPISGSSHARPRIGGAGSASAAPGASTAAPGASAVPAGSAPVGTEEGAVPAVPADAGPALQIYTTRTNPIELDGTLRGILAQVNTGDSLMKVTTIFERLRRGGTQGVTVMDMAGQMPRTASEAYARGGDCTDLANIVIALLRELQIPGGALVLHFEGAPENTDHMVPYAMIGGRRIIIDLQASRLNETAQGRHTEVLRITYDQAAFMYHREAGDYYRDQGQDTQAIAAYRRAIELYNGDGYTYQNLGVLLERAGDMAGAAQASRRAGELNPRYRRDATRGTYNEELQAGLQSADNRDWAGCVAHFRNALAAGQALTPADRHTIEGNIAACERNGGMRRK
ncbi:tetratricopeptide repeat protein [Candidatus Micrarchaeota archaeon]|nr:tetratricopeptide repeat protein [Candidatus Micrarchaeota archaeon]